MGNSDSRLAAFTRDLALARDALAEVALVLERDPDDPAAQAALVQLQAEVDAARRRVEHHELARVAAAREAERRSTAEVDGEVEGLIRRVEKLQKASAARAQRLLRAIEALGPEYAVLLVELAEARACTASAVRLRGGGAALRMMSASLEGHDVVAGAFGPALAATGLGIVGPTLAPWVVVTPSSGAFKPVDLGAAFAALHQRQIDTIERAATFGKEAAA